MESDDTLNILEQRPTWRRLVINVAFCFPLPETADTAAVVGRLQDGLESLARNFPWVAGQVINEGGIAKGNCGVFKIVPYNKPLKVIVKDHRQTPSVPSMRSLRQGGYAVSMLDESVFAPRPAFVLVPPEEKTVLLIQANILLGGLVLIFSGDHAAMDMPGLGQLIHWFSKACHNEAFTPAELEAGNMPRRNLIPLLDSTYQQGKELSQQVPLTPTSGLSFPRVPCTWATFKIPPRAVNEIKAIATATRTSSYVSTDDSLSAFIWQSIAPARLQRLPLHTVSAAARAIDVRKPLALPRRALVASEFRDAITCPSPSLDHYTRVLATALSRSADKNALRVAANLDLSSDLLFTSSVASQVYHCDFALGLGAPEAATMTQQITFESMAYLLPLKPDGDVTVVLCLREADLTALLAEESFSKYANYVGRQISKL